MNISHHPLTWIELRKDALLHNIKQLRSIMHPRTVFAPVLKGNAYGHGLVEIGRICNQVPEVDWICVVALSEAITLRMQGIQKPILVLNILDADLSAVVKYDLRIIAPEESMLPVLNALGKKYNKIIPLHLKIDTGLSRAGIAHTAALMYIDTVKKYPFLLLEGIFTHLIQPGSDDPAMTEQQCAQFNNFIPTLPEKMPFVHCANTAGLLRNVAHNCNLVRPGIGIYGLWPNQETKIYSKRMMPHIVLKPVLTWKTRIIQIKKIPADSCVGYDCTFQTNRETTIGLLPVGYYDGYDRKLSNKGVVRIGRYLAPVIGRVSMNLITIDITEIPNVNVGTEVILLDDTPELSADALAKHVGTINYEIVTRINPLIPHVVI